MVPYVTLRLRLFPHLRWGFANYSIRGIDGLPFALDVCIAVLINQVFSLALSCPQDSSFMVFAFLGHCQTPFRDGKSLDMTHLLYHIKAAFYITNFR